MNSEFIPESITQNPNFDWSDQERIEELNNMFKEIHNLNDEISHMKEYKVLIMEINGRIDAEYNKKLSKINHEKKKKELDEEKKNLLYYNQNQIKI